MSDALIKARTNRIRTERHICRLLEPNRNTLVLYARFIGDTADYVANQRSAIRSRTRLGAVFWGCIRGAELVFRCRFQSIAATIVARRS